MWRTQCLGGDVLVERRVRWEGKEEGMRGKGIEPDEVVCGPDDLPEVRPEFEDELHA